VEEKGLGVERNTAFR